MFYSNPHLTVLDWSIMAAFLATKRRAVKLRAIGQGAPVMTPGANMLVRMSVEDNNPRNLQQDPPSEPRKNVSI